ncbi:MAG TPA: 6-phosphofructokinase [Thermodesulfobacteriota bacterium]
MTKIGVLTGGGDCPGLNAVIRAVVRRAEQLGYDVMGLKGGWRGLIDRKHEKLTLDAVSGILPRGGTILGTSRTNPFKRPEHEEALYRNWKELSLDALVAIGGEDTLGVARRLHEKGYRVVGVPKTIDNDLGGTDVTFGFDTAVAIVTEAIDRLHTTAEAHNRVMVVEVMGRHAGWIATYSGIAGGADVILIPERPFDLDEVCALITRRHARGKNFSIVVVAEGATPKEAPGQATTASKETDAFGHVRLGGVGNYVGEEIEKRTGYETRVTILGHVQRGGTPTAYDRILATRYGVHAVEMVQRGEWGMMAALRGNRIVSVPLSEATAELKLVDPETFRIAEVFFG